MARVLVNESSLEDIGDAIREQNGTSDTYLPSEMAAAVRAIQTGAVDSVNGKTGVVVLTASDVGAGTYSKPSGGIPKSDLASAVQTSLGKADTALQAAPVTSVNGNTGDVTITPGGIGAATTQDVKKINNAFDNVIPLRSELEYPIQMGTCAFNGPSRSYDIYRANRDIVDAEHDTSDAWTGPRTTASAYAGNVDLALKSLESALAAAESQRLAMYPTDTAEGTAVSISDGADDVPVKALTVDIASQTGVTGATITRCGKNLLQLKANGDYTSSNLNFNINDGVVTVSGTSTNTSFARFALLSNPILLPPGTYTVSGQNDAGNRNLTLQVYNDDTATQIVNMDTSAEYQFTLSAATNITINCGIRVGATGNGDKMYPMLRVASIADATFEPYKDQVYVFDWTSSPGAITEGVLDAVAGKLTTGGQDYDVTPADVRTMLGNNTIYADCGDVSVTYRADIGLYINRKIAEANT